MGISNRTYTLRNCAYIVDSQQVVKTGSIVIEGQYIRSVGDEVEGDEIDCSQFIVVPGLVNGHTHLAMTVLRGFFDDGELHEWLSKMWNEEEKLSTELMMIGSEIGLIEMITSGTTAFVDMYFNPEQINTLSLKYGIRARAGPILMRESSVDEIMKKMRTLERSEFFEPIINVHSLYATDIEDIRELRNLLSEGEHVHIHVSETREEVFQIKKKYGLFPVELLQKEGLMKFLHGVHLGWVTSWELGYLREAISATHCPTSNMKLATGGVFPMREALDLGVNVTIGTDGAASNNSLNLFQEMKAAVMLQRHNYWSTSIRAVDVFNASTVNGYEMLGLKGGKIMPGYLADLVLIDKYQVYPLKEERILSHLVYNPPREVEKVIVGGKLIYEKGNFTKRLRELVEKLSLYL